MSESVRVYIDRQIGPFFPLIFFCLIEIWAQVAFWNRLKPLKTVAIPLRCKLMFFCASKKWTIDNRIHWIDENEKFTSLLAVSLNAVAMDNVDENTCDSLDELNFGTIFLHWIISIVQHFARNSWPLRVTECRGRMLSALPNISVASIASGKRKCLVDRILIENCKNFGGAADEFVSPF